jgi:N-acetylmuramic acid 6-phosphate etherase
MLTTTSMIKMGKVYGNLMVDLQATNKKLIDRGRRIISTLTGISYEEAAELLEKAQRNVKAAIVMEKSGVSYEEAMERLKKYDGAVRRAIENL